MTLVADPRCGGRQVVNDRCR